MRRQNVEVMYMNVGLTLANTVMLAGLIVTVLMG